MITSIIAIYGAFFSTLIFVCSLYKNKIKLDITYSKTLILDSDRFDGTAWQYLIINRSSRSIYLKKFGFINKKEKCEMIFDNMQDYDNIDANKTIVLEPNRSIEIFYDSSIKDQGISIDSFFAEEENGKVYFANNCFKKSKIK